MRNVSDFYPALTSVTVRRAAESFRSLAVNNRKDFRAINAEILQVMITEGSHVANRCPSLVPANKRYNCVGHKFSECGCQCAARVALYCLDLLHFSELQ